jgi:two-component system sensor histidine kinase UhpB
MKFRGQLKRTGVREASLIQKSHAFDRNRKNGGKESFKKDWGPLLQSQDMLNTIINGIREAIFIAREDGSLKAMNVAARQLIGEAMPDRMTLNIHDVFLLPHPQTLFSSLAPLSTVDPAVREAHLVNPSGGKIDIELHHHRVQVNGENHIILMALDISKRRQSEKALHQSQQKLCVLTAQLIKAQEEERQRISRELHDELGQGLATLKYFLASIKKNLASKPLSFIQQDCDHMLRYLEGFIENVRALCQDLRPAFLNILGLSQSLKHLLQEYCDKFNLSYTDEIADIDHAVSTDDTIHIYRIVQEALTNIAKHSHASMVSLTINKLSSYIHIVIKDNGVGFNYKTKCLANGSYNCGMGLAAMKERARIIGGSITLHSKKGMGTTITLICPAKYGETRSCQAAL